MAEPPPLPVRLADGADSGLASIVQQYLEQDLEEFADKRRLASRLRGRLAMTAADYETTVTVEFSGGEIAVWDGERPPLDASIVGPYRGLTRLLQGQANPLVEHLRGRLRVRSSLRRPFFPLRVHSLMKLPPEERARRTVGVWALAAAGALVVGGAVALALWLT
jgi:putative sterol carrier protein